MKAFKVLSIVFAILTILIGAGPIMRDTSLVDKINEEMAQISALSPELANMAMEQSGLPSTGSLYAAMSVSILVSLLALVGLFMAAKANPKVKIVGLLMIVLAIVAIVLHPAIDMGSTGGASPQMVAIVHGVPAMLTGLFMFLLAGKIKA